MKRQRGRNRSGGTVSGGSGGGGKPQHNANRAFESNGPENVKVRGAAQGVFEKYQQLARDATSAGDRVLAENYLQHAEHYFRVVRAVQPNRPVAEIIGRDQLLAFDIDFEAEPEDNEPEEQNQAEGSGESGGEGRADRFEPRRDDRQRDQNRDGQNRDYQNRDDRQRDQNRDGQNRDYQNRDQQNRDFQPRDQQRDQQPRDQQPRDQQPRDQQPRDQQARDDRPREGRFEGGRRERWRDRNDRPRGENGERESVADPLAVVEPRAEPLAAAAAPAPVAPVPVPTPEPAPVSKSPRLRGQDGDVSEAPAFLSRAMPAPVENRPEVEAAGEEPVKKVRRRKPVRLSDDVENSPQSEEA